jgi:glutaredoxin
MDEKVLFSLENCTKCTQTKELFKGVEDIKIITFPHNIDDWSNEEINNAKSHKIFDDLQITAPVLWINGRKIIGYLRIKKWLQDEKNR